VKVACPSCQTRYRIADERIPAGGATASCPNCGQQILIPGREKTREAAKSTASSPVTDFGQTIAYDFSGIDQSGTEVTALLEEISAREPFFAEGFSFFLRDAAAGREFPLEKPAVTVGRVGCDINLSDPEVSRKHCLVKVFGDRFIVIDQKSTNGTFFEGRKVMTAKFGKDGKFSVGNATLQAIVKKKG
jgi:predicted Zn finger-like uncharacterized protein